MSKNYKFDKKTEKNGETILSVTVQKEELKAEVERSFKKLKKNLKIKGFRKGNVPDTIAKVHLMKDSYEDAMNMILPRITAEILAEEEFRPITRLKYDVKKFSEEDGIEYEATFVNSPEIKLGDFKKIKVKKESPEVTDKELEEVMTNMYNAKEKQAADSKSDENSKSEAGSKGATYPDSSKEESPLSEGESKAPKFDDEWVKSLKFDGIETLDKLKEQIKVTVSAQKEQAVEEEYQSKVIAEAIKLSKIKVPEKIIEMSVEAEEQAYTKRIEEVGLKIDDFLRSQKKTIEDMRKTWTENIQRQVSFDLLSMAIAKEADIKVTDEEIDGQINAIGDKKMRKQYENRDGRNRVADVIYKQKVLNWLLQEVDKK